MRRKCAILAHSQKYNRAICIDTEQEDLLALLLDNERYRKKTDYIFRRILEQPNVYFEDYKILTRSTHGLITEMRFFPNGDNCRVYCKEEELGNNQHCIIIAAYIEKKKSQKINKNIWQIINKIKSYEYEL